MFSDVIHESLNLVAPCPMVIHYRLTTVMNVGIIIVMNVSCVSHNCHYSTRDTRQHRDMILTADHGAIMLVTKIFRQNIFLLSIDTLSYVFLLIVKDLTICYVTR